MHRMRLDPHHACGDPHPITPSEGSEPVNEWIVYGVHTPGSPHADPGGLVGEAEEYAAGLGAEIGEEFIDVGEDPVDRWVLRPQARRLLRYISDARCRAVVVVVPDPNSAFDPDDLETAAALVRHHGLDLHLVGTGPIRLGRGPRWARLALETAKTSNESIHRKE